MFFAEKDVFFLAQHTGKIKAHLDKKLIVCDYAVVQDLGYATLSKSESHLAVMTLLYDHLYGRLPEPSLIIYLQCDPEIQLQRIKARWRVEETSLSNDTLGSLNSATEKLIMVHHRNTPIYKFHSDQEMFNKCNAEIVQFALDNPDEFRIF